MMRWVLTLLLATALPIAAQDKDKGKKKAPEKKPTNEEIMSQAEEKAKTGDLQGGIEALRRVTTVPGAPADAFLRLGRLLETSYDYLGAIDAYKESAGRLSGEAKGEALGRLSIVQAMSGAPEAAANAEAAVEADPAGLWPTIALARARSQQGKGEEALALAQKAIAAGGGVAASVALGLAKEAMGDLAGAEQDLRSAMATEPGQVSAAVGLARVLRKTGRAAEAEPLLNKALADAPSVVDAYKESTRVKIALGRGADALGDAQTAAALADADPEAQTLVQLATVAKALGYLASNETNLAIQDLTTLRDANPTLAEARIGLARALVANRQVDAAISELNKAVELNPGLAEAHAYLGYVQFIAKGNPAAAVKAYEKAVALDPGNVEYLTQFGGALSEAKEFDRAVEILTKAVNTPGYRRLEGYIYLGRAYLNAARYREAIPPLEQATALAPTNVDAWAALAWSYFGLKDTDKFKEVGAKARALGYKEPKFLKNLTDLEAKGGIIR